MPNEAVRGGDTLWHSEVALASFSLAMCGPFGTTIFPLNLVCGEPSASRKYRAIMELHYPAMEFMRASRAIKRNTKYPFMPRSTWKWWGSGSSKA